MTFTLLTEAGGGSQLLSRERPPIFRVLMYSADIMQNSLINYVFESRHFDINIAEIMRNIGGLSRESNWLPPPATKGNVKVIPTCVRT